MMILWKLTKILIKIIHLETSLLKQGLICLIGLTLSGVKEFYGFLELSHNKLLENKYNAADRCGLPRINGEIVVPYTTLNNVKYVPVFYC